MLTIGAIEYGASAIKKRSITIDHTQCGSSDSSNFPVLVSINDATLKTVSNGGHVANTNGYDINFYSDSGYTMLMNWEVEFYDPVNGILCAWVVLGTVSHSSNTVFYMKYGDPTITTYQGGTTTTVWDANFLAVWHVPNGTVLSKLDSTSHARTLVGAGPTATTGKIDGGAALVGATNAYFSTTSTGALTKLTASAWINPTSTAQMAVICGGSVGWYLRLQAGNNTGLDLGGRFKEVTLPVSANVWTHVCMTWDASTLVVYKNGASIGSVAAVGTLADTSNLFVGTFENGSTNFTGTIDETRVSNINRSADWIKTEYNNQNTPGNFGSAAFLTYSNEM